tara:strand:- start:434 stop:1030 length:597 start_codon:yes stop_codon:yes gene_type:complete
MIRFKNLSKKEPFIKFKDNYDQAILDGQDLSQAMLISSFSHETNEVDSRFVNLKFIEKEEFIFFSNYLSPKSSQFKSHKQISAVFFWSKINLQIRMKAEINKVSKDYNNKYFKNRDKEKNALAISSRQSELIDSYDAVKENYNKSLRFDVLDECPDYWGGYSFTPYYFEFWEGHSSRLNKRDVYERDGDTWNHSILQP